MPQTKIKFAADGNSKWAGMGDYILISPDGVHRVELIYKGEPPHGDSYHQGIIDGRPFPGYIWGCQFAFSACSRYVVFSWMQELYERLTVVVNLQNTAFFTLPEYIYDFEVHWPVVLGKSQSSEGKQYTFKFNEKWKSY